MSTEYAQTPETPQDSLHARHEATAQHESVTHHATETAPDSATAPAAETPAAGVRHGQVILGFAAIVIAFAVASTRWTGWLVGPMAWPAVLLSLGVFVVTYGLITAIGGRDETRRARRRERRRARRGH